MNSQVIIIAPEIAPGSGGVADYTLRILREWGDRIQTRILLPAPNADSGAETVERSRAALLEKLPASGGKVLLQYSAYGFDRFGYPRWLLRALADWKSAGGGRLVLMLHEIWTFWPALNRNYLVQQLHRRDLRSLLSLADATFTSTASQAEHLRELATARRVEVLPVGSNIRLLGPMSPLRERGRAVIFGLQSARLRVLRELSENLAALARAGRLTKIATVGGGNSVAGDRTEEQLLGTLPLRNGFQPRGPLLEAEVSAELARAEFGLSVQDELSLTKSGSFMACAAHGLNIISPIGDPQRPAPLCWLTTPEECLRGLSEEELQTRARHLQAWQEEAASWPVIANRFAEALSL